MKTWDTVPQRTRADVDRDAIARIEIAAEQQRIKKLKDRARIDKMLAKKRGDLKRMPLSGAAALAAIRGKL